MDEKKKILVIDDDKTIHTLLKFGLEKEGYQVFAALDSMQGMMMAKQVKPDLIILDIMMPAGGGFVVYERLQMMLGSFQVPFLIYSALAYSEIATKIHESPQVEIISKNAKLEDIMLAIKRLTGG